MCYYIHGIKNYKVNVKYLNSIKVYKQIIDSQNNYCFIKNMIKDIWEEHPVGRNKLTLWKDDW